MIKVEASNRNDFLEASGVEIIGKVGAQMSQNHCKNCVVFDISFFCKVAENLNFVVPKGHHLGRFGEHWVLIFMIFRGSKIY